MNTHDLPEGYELAKEQRISWTNSRQFLIDYCSTCGETGACRIKHNVELSVVGEFNYWHNSLGVGIPIGSSRFSDEVLMCSEWRRPALGIPSGLESHLAQAEIKRR